MGGFFALRKRVSRVELRRAAATLVASAQTGQARGGGRSVGGADRWVVPDDDAAAAA